MTQAMTAFTDDVLSTLTPRRPRRTTGRNAKPAAATKSKPSAWLTASSPTRSLHQQPSQELPDQQK